MRPSLRAGLGPTLALLVGVAAAAVLTPLVVDDGPGATGPSGTPQAPSPVVAPSTTGSPSTTDPGPTEAPPAPPASTLRLRVVPAVRDVGVMVSGTRYDSDAEGLIEVPLTDGAVAVTVIGYSVAPAFQKVSFTGWEDGSIETSRTLRGTGGDGEADLGVDVSYRVTATGSAEPTLLRSDTGSVVALPPGAPTWVPARVAVADPEGGLMGRDVGYEVEVGGRPRSGRFTPTPEALLDVG